MTVGARLKAQLDCGVEEIEKTDLAHKRETSLLELHKISCGTELLCVLWLLVYGFRSHGPEDVWMRAPGDCFGLVDKEDKDTILVTKDLMVDEMNDTSKSHSNGIVPVRLLCDHQGPGVKYGPWH